MEAPLTRPVIGWAEVPLAETADPVEALSALDIPTRAAGARDLALSGTLEHVPQLSSMSLEDRSPGVRLHCAGATADILSRYRDPSLLDTVQREAWYQLFLSSDPGFNPGLFQVASELATPGCINRILVGMRDPRVDVRQGACVGLLRLCQQGRWNGDADLEARVVALLTDGRIKPDTRVELARICSLVGYRSALPIVEAFSGLAPKLEEGALEAVARLREPGPVEGFWVEAGIDSGELVARARLGEVVIVVGGELLKGGQAESLNGPIRRMWVKERGWDGPDAVLQLGIRSYFAAEAEDIATAADQVVAADRPALEESLASLWPENAAGKRALGAIALRRGRVEEALRLLGEALELKKVPVDTAWWMAEALVAAGRAEEARPYLEKFVAKAPKKHPALAEARRRLELSL